MTAVLFDGAAMARRNLSTAAHLLQQMECRMWDLLRTFHRGARQLRDCRAKRLRIV
jgi:hypothetical protein